MLLSRVWVTIGARSPRSPLLQVCRSRMEGRREAGDGGNEAGEEKAIRQSLIVRSGRAGGPNPSDLGPKGAGWGHVCPNIDIVLLFQIPFHS